MQQTKAPPQVLMTVPEAAAELRCTRNRIYELISKKQLPSVRLGQRQLRISRQQLDEFVQNGGTQQ